MSNTFYEAWIIKYFQPEDAAWNAFIVKEFEAVAPAVKYLMELGWSPIVETVYLGELIYSKDGGGSGGGEDS
jgi:hypothetical protein